MKKIIVILMLGLIFTYSCNNEEKTTNLLNSESHLLLINKESVVTMSTFEPTKSQSIQAVTKRVDESDLNYLIFNKFNNIIDVSVLENNAPLGIVVYLSKVEEEILDDDIIGISVFLNSTDSYIHKCFPNRGYPCADILYDFEFSSFNTSDFDVILHALCDENPTTQLGYVFFTTNDLSKKKNNKEEIPTLSSYLIDNTDLMPNNSKGGCGSSCFNDSGRCVYDEYNSPLCDNCAISSLEATVRNVSPSEQVDLEKEFPKSFAYSFRDDLLIKYSIGKRYIDYYYKLSYFITSKKTITVSNFTEHVIFAKDIYNVAKTLKDGEPNEIVISQSFVNDANIFINEYSSKTSNDEFIKMLEQVKNDLNRFKGLTKREFFDAIE